VIDEFVTRGDLVDRSLILYMQAIRLAHRRTEAEYWRSFRADYPAILGGLLDVIAAARRQLPSVVLTKAPRMADFAHWGEAVGRGLVWPEQEVLKSYLRNRRAATVAVIEDSLVGSMLLSGFSSWSGTFFHLHSLLTEAVDKKTAGSAGWPKTVPQFARELHRIAPQLRTHGLSITCSRHKTGRRLAITRQ